MVYEKYGNVAAAYGGSHRLGDLPQPCGFGVSGGAYAIELCMLLCMLSNDRSSMWWDVVRYFAKTYILYSVS